MYRKVVPAKSPSHTIWHARKMTSCTQVCKIRSKSLEVIQDDVHLFSNEDHTDALSSLKAYTTDDTENGAVIIVGEGHLVSELPEYSRFGSMIFVLDINPLVLEHLAFQHECLISSETRESFLTKYRTSTNPFVAHYGDDVEYSLFALDNQLYEEGKNPHSFLSSDDRYAACREAALKTTVCFKHLNMCDVSACKKFAKAVYTHGLQVKLINTTNLEDWYSDSTLLSRCVATLANFRSIPIMHSSISTFKKLNASAIELFGSKLYCRVDSAIWRPTEEQKTSSYPSVSFEDYDHSSAMRGARKISAKSPRPLFRPASSSSIETRKHIHKYTTSFMRML